jgi:hypothetical protein
MSIIIDDEAEILRKRRTPRITNLVSGFPNAGIRVAEFKGSNVALMCQNAAPGRRRQTVSLEPRPNQNALSLGVKSLICFGETPSKY